MHQSFFKGDTVTFKAKPGNVYEVTEVLTKHSFGGLKEDFVKIVGKDGITIEIKPSSLVHINYVDNNFLFS